MSPQAVASRRAAPRQGHYHKGETGIELDGHQEDPAAGPCRTLPATLSGPPMSQPGAGGCRQPLHHRVSNPSQMLCLLGERRMNTGQWASLWRT